MPKYLLIVDHRPGVIEQPMDEWPPGDVTAHMNYYGAMLAGLRASGEL
jgi:hypothetical protein